MYAICTLSNYSHLFISTLCNTIWYTKLYNALCLFILYLCLKYLKCSTFSQMVNYLVYTSVVFPIQGRASGQCDPWSLTSAIVTHTHRENCNYPLASLFALTSWPVNCVITRNCPIMTSHYIHIPTISISYFTSYLLPCIYVIIYIYIFITHSPPLPDYFIYTPYLISTSHSHFSSYINIHLRDSITHY